MTKLRKKTVSLFIVMTLILAMPGINLAQRPSRKVRQAQKKAEKVEIQQKKAYEQARKKEIKRRFNMQTPETKERMKQTRREAREYNKSQKDSFFERLFRKKKHKKMKRKKPGRR